MIHWTLCTYVTSCSYHIFSHIAYPQMKKAPAFWKAGRRKKDLSFKILLGIFTGKIKAAAVKGEGVEQTRGAALLTL